jgi:flagellar biogenesis protein FliO
MSTTLVTHEIETSQEANVSTREQMLPAARALFDLLVKGYAAVRKVFTVQRVQKQLRVCETVSLGEKRFVAVVQVDQERFLIGGSAGSVSMLSRLAETPSFSSTMQRLTEAGAGER